jgi:hypothetical protein
MAVEPHPGTHICGIYSGKRQLNEIVVPLS